MDEEIGCKRLSWKQSRGGRERGYSWEEVALTTLMRVWNVPW